MIYKRIKTTTDPLFKNCWEIYCSNFPLEERRDLLEQKRIFEMFCSHPNEQEHKFIFNALLKRHESNAPAQEDVMLIEGTPCNLVGVFAYWDFSEVVFGEHLAISQKVQGTGIGKIAIDHLKAFARLRNKPILLEIEVPQDTITKRRESFYKRLGFKTNPHEHFQPCYHKGDEPIEMIIMTWPEIVSDEIYQQFKAEQQTIMPTF